MNRGEIWLIDLEPTIGAEIRKTRPAIIVNDERLGKLPLKVIVPITDWKTQYAIAPWMVNILPSIQNGLSKESCADCFQIRSLSQQRFVKYIGIANHTIMEEITLALSVVLKIKL
jgi:mRNA interferase MazF